MRETLPCITLPAISPSLESVCHQFGTWRKKRRCRGEIPEALWQAAVGLCREHSICEVSRSLRLNYNELKDRVTRVKDKSPAVGRGPDLNFVRLDRAVEELVGKKNLYMGDHPGARVASALKKVTKKIETLRLK